MNNQPKNDLSEALADIRKLLDDAKEMVENSRLPTSLPLPERFSDFIERLELLALKIQRVIDHEGLE